MVKKTVTPFEGKLITFETQLPFEEVIARFEAALNKKTSFDVAVPFYADEMARPDAPKTKEELIQQFDQVTNNSKALRYFGEYDHEVWLKLWHDKVAKNVIFLLGNPSSAESILRHDLVAGYNIPPRLLVLEKADGSGTSVVYQQFSSVVLVGPNVSEGLKEAALSIDVKLEGFVTKVLGD